MNQEGILTDSGPRAAGLDDGSVILLAGGKSTRMKEDKARLPLGRTGKSLLEWVANQLTGHFAEIILSRGAHALTPEAEDFYNRLPFRKVRDRMDGWGPMSGILAGLEASRTGINFVVACDIPEMDIPYIQKMFAFAHEYDLVIPVSSTGYFEPLFGFYHRRTIPLIEGLLAKGRRRVIDLFDLCRVRYVDTPSPQWPRNLNTAEDYREYLQWLEFKHNEPPVKK